MPDSSSQPELEILPLARLPAATVAVPGSKSISNRALLLAALTARGQGHELHGLLRSEDTRVMANALRALGFQIEPQWIPTGVEITAENWEKTTISAGDTDTVAVRNPDGQLIPRDNANLCVENSGTAMRFLSAMVALGHGRYRLDGIDRMRQRPIGDLLAGLRQLNVKAVSELGTDCPPVVVEAAGLRGGRVRISGAMSSQFLSGLLMAAPFAQSDITIELEDVLVSRPYVDMTLAMMGQFGLRADEIEPRRFHVAGGQQGRNAGPYMIEPDASAASYFWAAAAITGGTVTVPGLTTASLQGDVRLVDVLEQMGCVVRRGTDGITVQGCDLRGVDVDMNELSDCVMTLAAVACFARGRTLIRNIAHIRYKESDRIHALATELGRVGISVEETEDGICITPGPLKGARISTYNDHRMAMSMALLGLRVPGITILNPHCVAKTYPHFFTDLEKLRGDQSS